MPSFDIVNQLDLQEIDNAVNMVKRDIATRYDFKGSSSSITLSKSDKNIVINGDVEYQIDTIFDMLQNRAISRKVSVKVFKSNETENASGMTFRKKLISNQESQKKMEKK